MKVEAFLSFNDPLLWCFDLVPADQLIRTHFSSGGRITLNG
jgi:hypothetical protein